MIELEIICWTCTPKVDAPPRSQEARQAWAQRVGLKGTCEDHRLLDKVRTTLRRYNDRRGHAGHVLVELERRR